MHFTASFPEHTPYVAGIKMSAQLNSDTYLVFVGYASDASRYAEAVRNLEATIQAELDRYKTKYATMFRKVKIWTWERDASLLVGGQQVVVSPIVSEAHLAVFLFWNRLGEVTCEELEVARYRHPAIPVCAFFSDRSNGLQFCALENKRLELSTGWSETDSKAIVPLPRFTNELDLRELAKGRILAELERAVLAEHTTLITRYPQRPKLVFYDLQCAQHFSGREQLVLRLQEWITCWKPEQRVISVVGPGGTGKTAIAEHIVSRKLQSSNPFGVFVWSFYQNQNPESFFAAACAYLTGQVPQQSDLAIDKLHQVLRSDDCPHLFVLDGLELLQSNGEGGRVLGELTAPQLKRFLRILCSGNTTSAKVLLTSRFPLPDLNDWKHGGYECVELPDLDRRAARAVFRKWSVSGSDAALDVVAEQVQRHALTVDVLGSFLNTFHGGDISKAPEFDSELYAQTDSKSAKLNRVLAAYAEILTDAERSIVSVLSNWTRGIGYQTIVSLAATRFRGLESLAECTEGRLKATMHRLQCLGLIFSFQVDGEALFTAHPFIREFFSRLLGISGRQEIYKAVRDGLVASLSQRPARNPESPSELDRCESLIEALIYSDEIDQALDTYWDVIGGFKRLSTRLGENLRGRRILLHFCVEGVPARALEGKRVDVHQRLSLLNDLSLYATRLGDLKLSAECLEAIEMLGGTKERSQVSCLLLQRIAELRCDSGQWPRALVTIEPALLLVRNGTVSASEAKFLYPLAGEIYGAMGQLGTAFRYFAAARGLEKGNILYSRRGAREIQLQMQIGAVTEAETQLKYSLEICERNKWGSDIALCHALLGYCQVERDPEAAETSLLAAQRYADAAGHASILLECSGLRSTILLRRGDFRGAFGEAADAIQAAEANGFKAKALELGVKAAKASLQLGEVKSALERAKEIVEKSRSNECGYIWPEIRARVICAEAIDAGGRNDLALEELSLAQRMWDNLSASLRSDANASPPL